MNNLVITVESGSDMPEDLAGQYGIFIVPMYVQFGDKTCADGSFPPSEVCRYFKETGKVPKTSGSSPDDYRKVFDEIHSRWPEKKILHLAYSAVTTCSFQSAQIAAAGKVRMCFLPCNLTYLRAGGRCGNLTALCGNLLQIHPRIEVLEGYLRATKKYRGSMKISVSRLIHDYAAQEDLDRGEVWFLRTVDVYVARIRNKFADCRSFEIVTVHGFGYKAVLKE